MVEPEFRLGSEHFPRKHWFFGTILSICFDRCGQRAGLGVELLLFIGGYCSRRLSNCRKQPYQLQRQSFYIIEEPKASALLRPLNRVIVANRMVDNFLAGAGELYQLHRHFSQNGRKFN